MAALDRESALRIALLSLVGLGTGALSALAEIGFVEAVLWAT